MNKLKNMSLHVDKNVMREADTGGLAGICILLILTFLILGYITFIEILHAFSDM